MWAQAVGGCGKASGILGTAHRAAASPWRHARPGDGRPQTGAVQPGCRRCSTVPLGRSLSPAGLRSPGAAQPGPRQAPSGRRFRPACRPIRPAPAVAHAAACPPARSQASTTARLPGSSSPSSQQVAPRVKLVPVRQGPLERSLDPIVGTARIKNQRPGVAPQPRNRGEQLASETTRSLHQRFTGRGGRLFPAPVQAVAPRAGKGASWIGRCASAAATARAMSIAQMMS